MLLTTLPAEDLATAEMVLRYYSHRWRVERDHYVLKSGCHVEDLQLETFDRLERALAVYRIVAWRLLWLTYLARKQPDQPCTTVLRTAVRWIAQWGGFLGRRSDGEPGVKTLWRGYRRLEDLTALWEILHPPG